LRTTPSEIVFYNSLGLGVLLISCLGGIAACASLAYVIDQRPEDIWLVGLGWAILLSCGIERLVLQTPGSREAWKPLIVGVAIRVFVSILIGFMLAEPLILKINEPEINRYLHNQATAERHEVIAGAKGTYEPLINRAVAKRSAIYEQENRLENRRDEFRALADCGSESPACLPATAREYTEKADREASRLDRARARNAPKLQALNANIERRQSQKGDEETGGWQSVAESNGVLARIEALGSIAATDPVANIEAWILRLFFISIDLLPLAIKVSRSLAFDSAYEARYAASRGQDLLRAEEEAAAVDIARQRMKDQVRADKRVNQAAIAADAERRIGDGDGADPFDFDDSPSSAMSLDEFIDDITDYGSRVVDVPDDLRRSALIGLALIGGSLVIGLSWALLGGSLLGALLPLFAGGFAVALGVFTGGFRQAPAWAMRPVLWTFICGLISIPLVTLVNVV